MWHIEFFVTMLPSPIMSSPKTSPFHWNISIKISPITLTPLWHFYCWYFSINPSILYCAISQILDMWTLSIQGEGGSAGSFWWRDSSRLIAVFSPPCLIFWHHHVKDRCLSLVIAEFGNGVAHLFSLCNQGALVVFGWRSLTSPATLFHSLQRHLRFIPIQSSSCSPPTHQLPGFLFPPPALPSPEFLPLWPFSPCTSLPASAHLVSWGRERSAELIRLEQKVQSRPERSLVSSRQAVWNQKKGEKKEERKKKMSVPLGRGRWRWISRVGFVHRISASVLRAAKGSHAETAAVGQSRSLPRRNSLTGIECRTWRERMRCSARSFQWFQCENDFKGSNGFYTHAYTHKYIYI